MKTKENKGEDWCRENNPTVLAAAQVLVKSTLLSLQARADIYIIHAPSTRGLLSLIEQHAVYILLLWKPIGPFLLPSLIKLLFDLFATFPPMVSQSNSFIQVNGGSQETGKSL